MSVIIITLLLSVALCGGYLLLARRWQLVDRPNERSSHQVPTPHGGGVPMLLAFACALALHGDWSGPYLLLAGTALLLMLVGIVDDLRGLSVRLRFACYGLCCLLVAHWLLQPAGLSVWVLTLFWALVLLWSLNLYNFMDGIDGIAALQCVLACSSAALLAWFRGAEGQYAAFCLLLAAAQLGFLCWNWPPARMFMGDGGSIPSGFLLAGLALLGAVGGQFNPLCWLILLAPFVTDATVTLLWRMATGQPFTRPHRLHAYQRLSRHWGSHLAVDMLLLALNALWLAPLAWAVEIWPKYGFLLVILAYLPLLAGMAKVRKLG